MSWYFVYVREERENKPEMRTTYYSGDHLDPPEPVWCADTVKASSPAQAKYHFLVDWAGTRGNSSVEWEDWPLLRVRVLSHGDEATEDELWFRIHEILDHAGGSCDCPVLEPSTPVG